MRIVQFRADNWQEIINYSDSGTILSNNVHRILDPLDSSILLDSSIIAVYVTTSVPEGKTWNFAGRVEQRFRSGLTVGGLTDAAGQSHPLWLDKITTILFNKISAEYSLKFLFPRWFRNVQVLCWMYTGLDDDASQVALSEEIANVNFKLDQIQGLLQP
jgi:hypothetical protein